jgi:rhomboid protease GluP
MYSSALQRHEYWRLVTYGFLHVDFVHLTGNMLCLALWGGHLEKRVGSLYFLIIYFCGMIFGAVIGDIIHSTPYLTVGASGATSGILGALLGLWILGKISLDANFFVINIGLNIAFALSYSRVNWQVHLGGFAAGLIACAMLDLVEKMNFLVLRCKFPEFIKVNMFVLACAAGVLLWSNQPAAMAATPDGLTLAAASIAAVCLVTKAVDILLSLRKGLAVVVIALATVNAAALLLGSIVFASSLSAVCTLHRSAIEALLNAACSTPALTLGIVSLGAFALTLLLNAKELYRGIEDVGFVGASLRAERKRRHGI